MDDRRAGGIEAETGGQEEKDIYSVSALGKTWIFDLDGTVVKHNGYQLEGRDSLLAGAKDFFDRLPREDLVIFVTSRTEECRQETEAFLRSQGIPFAAVIYGAPFGERILVNDKKPSGLKTAIAVNTRRDQFMETVFEVDESL